MAARNLCCAVRAISRQKHFNCTELEGGARMVDALITNTMLPEIGREILARLAAGSEMRKVHVGTNEGNFLFKFE